MPSFRDRCYPESRQATHEKTGLDATIGGSTHFSDHCQRRVDERRPRQRTVWTNSTNRKPRLVGATDVPAGLTGRRLEKYLSHTNIERAVTGAK